MTEYAPPPAPPPGVGGAGSELEDLAYTIQNHKTPFFRLQDFTNFHKFLYCVK